MLGDRDGEVYPYSTQNGSVTTRPMPLAHDWEQERRNQNDFYDDGTMTYFWRAHRIIVLVIFCLVLLYVALIEEAVPDSDYNAKRGLVGIVLAFVLFGVIHTPDGPFKRPHPAFWRLVLMLHIVYELALVFLLFQSVDDARRFMKIIDPELGQPLPEKDYGGSCLVYDPHKPEDPWHNLWDKMDGFVVVHFFGWWAKTLILRDWWLCMVVSIMFEFLEYSLEHQLPNFSECWWDHWVMDALVCNSLGIYMGMKTLKYLKMKKYHWRGMWNIPTYRGKITRVMKQFTPYSWMEFDWRPTSSLKRWLSCLIVIGLFLLAELNTFYLKFVLWIPPPHFLCLGRLVLLMLWGAVAMREIFQYMDDVQCKKIGAQTWLILTMIVTEILITLKFGKDTVLLEFPLHVKVGWIGGLLILLLWTIWHFYVQRLLWYTEGKLKGTKKAASSSKENGAHSHNNNSGENHAGGGRKGVQGSAQKAQVRSRTKKVH